MRSGNGLEFNIGLSLLPLFSRIIIAACIVILVAKLVVKLGPAMGGIVAGLPVGLGPGFYFLMQAGNHDFLFQSALYSLVALSATQYFLLAYLLLANIFGYTNCSFMSVGIWVILASVLYRIDFSLLQASLLFIFSTIVTRYIGSFFLRIDLAEKKSENDFILFLRALAGGLIIAIVTLFASTLGAQLSGVLLAFPIAYVLISFNIHKGFGEITVTKVVYSAILGTISLAVFCIVFAVFLHKAPLIYILCISLIGSVLMTALMLVLEAKFQKHCLFLN